MHDIRKLTLWGKLMAGGAGVEYYFGYQLPENDLVCEDFRSRDKSWDYCRIALDFFPEKRSPLRKCKTPTPSSAMRRRTTRSSALRKTGELYLVYLPNGGSTDIDLTGEDGAWAVQWFNPRKGGPRNPAAGSKSTAAAKSRSESRLPMRVRTGWS